MITRKFRITAIAALFAVVGALGAPAFAQGSGGFVSIKSAHGYAATVSALQHAVKNNGLMVMGKVNQKAILSMTGLHLQGAESFLIGNPRVGKKLFSMNPAVAAVVPSRISVWVQSGTTYIGYFQPSSQMGAISAELAKPGKMLDMKFHKIAEDAAH